MLENNPASAEIETDNGSVLLTQPEEIARG
jgi:hypothetical protein